MNILRPKLVLGAASIIIFLILFSLVQEMNRRWQVQREVQRLEQEVRQAEKRMIELENLNQYFRTDDYQERLAREKLDYRASGEEVVLIPEEQATADAPGQGSQNIKQALSIPLRWWHIFFVEPRPFSTSDQINNS